MCGVEDPDHCVSLSHRSISEFGIDYFGSYSLMGRGMLTGQIKSFDDILDADFRKMLPRFQPESFETNLKLVKEV